MSGPDPADRVEARARGEGDLAARGREDAPKRTSWKRHRHGRAACPVDAIIGASKQMHTVIIDECTGCDLCVAPGPVDCIDMVPVKPTPQTWQWELGKGIGDIPIKQLL